jgi:hypothetical protein|tara:strand:- start:21184 stop:21537 length:354 start_codon:yes stop_codon:yes gene_type:complete
MKQIKGIVELHGDGIQINEGNNEQFVVIENISSYDFEGVIMNQTNTWKLDLIKDLCEDVGIAKVAKKIDGLYAKPEMEDCWLKAANYTDEVMRIASGYSKFSTPIRDSKEQYFKDKK